jgi:putative phosphoribosyl transferase
MAEEPIFRDRREAGRELARRLHKYSARHELLVLGVPRGGVPVAMEVASALKAPLDTFVSRKLGVPGQEELAFGAVASGGTRILDEDIVDAVGISESEIERIAARETQELERREQVFRAGRPPLDVQGKTVVLVDDGIATGASIRVAIAALRRMRPAEIVVAAPVIPLSTCERLRREADDVIAVHTPKSFYAIGEFYDDFSQVTDEEVIKLLRQAASKEPKDPPAVLPRKVDGEART